MFVFFVEIKLNDLINFVLSLREVYYFVEEFMIIVNRCVV